jgi:DNA modification methylase
MKDTILYGDCRQTLDTLKSHISIGICDKPRMCVTSPPYYGLRDYGGENSQIGQEQTPEEYIQEMVNVLSKVKDCLSDDGTLWLNIGDSYYNYRPGKSYPKQTFSKTKQDLPDYTPKRANKLDNYKEKDLIGIPWMLAFALRSDGWYLRQDIIWHKPNPMPESVRDRCTKSHEYIFLLSKNKKYYYDNESIKEPAKDWGTRDRSKGKYHNEGTGLNPHTGLTKSYPTKNKRSVWSITKKPYKGAHFATFPEDLIIPCIKAGSQKGDIILDPFIGSGTTAVVARDLGRHYIGCELHEEYSKLIDERVPTNKVVHNGLTEALAEL